MGSKLTGREAGYCLDLIGNQHLTLFPSNDAVLSQVQEIFDYYNISSTRNVA